MRAAVSIIRLAVSALVVVAVGATFTDTATRSTIDPFNFFGYFTIQANLLLALVLGVTALLGLRRARVPAWLDVVRGAATAGIVVVGLVYNLLLAGTVGAGGVMLHWANVVLHGVVPLVGLLDWIVVADRRPLPWRLVWVVLLYPAVWTTVVLVRGATDGWVPYPFLDPVTGYDAVAAYVGVIAVAFTAVGALVWLLSRLRLLVVPGGDRGDAER